MSTACQIHVSGSFETKPIPPVAKHIFITVAYIDSVLCPTQALLIQKRHFFIVLQISTALSTTSRIEVHISFGCQVTQLSLLTFGDTPCPVASSHWPCLREQYCTCAQCVLTSSTKIQRRRQHSQLVTQCFTSALKMRRLSDEANLNVLRVFSLCCLRL